MKIRRILIYFLCMINSESYTKIEINNSTELPLVISVCAYNNASWVEKNLDSIFMQKYNNFHVVYIDDASTDDTAFLVQQYIDTHQLHEKITLLVNPLRCRKTKNIYNFFHAVADEEIIIQVDGDDWLAHDQVFSCVNQTYQQQGVWLTYGQFIGYPCGKLGNCVTVPYDIITNRSFRSWKWVYTHLRTFYAWLFKNIKLEDFINEQIPDYEGNFFPLGDDTLSYFPMLEMCGDKFAFIPDILYVYNRANPLLTVKVEGNLRNPADKDIRSRSKYPQVKKSLLNRLANYKDARADLIIISKDNPDGVKTILNSLSGKITGIDETYILYEQNDTITLPYQELQTTYPSVQFIPILDMTVSKALLNLLQNSKQDHIIMAKDTAIVLDSLDIHKCIIELERTYAYGFYFGFGHNTSPFNSANNNAKVLPHEHIYNDIYAWKFKCAPKTLCNNFNMTLLRKKIVQERVAQLANTDSIDSFINSWQTAQHANMHNVGLFFEKVKLGRTQVNRQNKTIHKELLQNQS